jgi:hypothetical protein
MGLFSNFMTNKEYDSLVKYTLKLIHKLPQIIVSDVVNEVLLLQMESGKQFDETETKKAIWSYVKNLIHNERPDNNKSKICDDETTKFCKTCNEDQPIGAFSIITRKNGTREIFHQCKNCQAATMREYYSNNRDLVRERLRKRYKDSVVKGKLKKQGKKNAENERINPIAFLSFNNFTSEIKRALKKIA